MICPYVCECIDALNEICHGGMAFLMEESWGAVLGKVSKFFTATALGIRAVAAKMTCSSTKKKHLSSLDIILIVESVSVAVIWCAALSFSTSVMNSARVWGSFCDNYLLVIAPGTLRMIPATSLGKVS